MRLVIFLCNLVWIMMFAPSAFARTPPSAYDFIKPSENNRLVLSPSGNQIAYSHIKTDKFCLDRYGQMKPSTKKKCSKKNRLFRSTYTLVVSDLNTGKISKTIAIPENMSIGWINFISEDRVLVSVRRSTTIGQSGRAWSYGGSRVLSVKLNPSNDEEAFVFLFQDNKKVRKQNSYLTKVTNILRDEPNHVLMPAYKSSHLDLWKVDVRDGSSERVGEGKSGTFYWYTDRLGKPVFRFDCKGRKCRKINVYGYSDTQEKWEKIRTFKLKPDEDEEDFDFYPVAPTDNENQFYVISEDETEDRRSVKIFDLETQEYVKTVFQDPKYDVGGVILGVDTGDYQGVWHYEDRLKYTFLDSQKQKHFRALNKYFKNKSNVRFIGFNEDGNVAIIHANSPDSAGAYYAYDFQKAKIELLVRNEPYVDDALNSDGDVLSIEMRDGQSITAYHYYPKNKKMGSLPLIVMPHGGPEARDYYGYDYTVQYFVSRGYQVIQMNYRGSSGYGKDFAEMGYGEWGGLMQNDLTDTVKYFHNRGLATADKTCIVGYSYGGYAALYGGAATPELYKCIVSGGGLSDLTLSMKNIARDYGKDSETYQYWIKSKGNPKTEKNMYFQKSPVNLAENFTSPVLLIHGEYDDNVYINQSKVMKKALEKAGKEVNFVELKGEGHSGWSLENEIIYFEAIEAFLAKHIGQ